VVIRAPDGQHHMRVAFAIESNDAPAPEIMSQPVRFHDEPAPPTAPRGERQEARLRFRGPPPRNPVNNEPTRLEVE
jgi:hypothetical protein